MAAGKSGIVRDIPAGERYGGTHAVPIQQWKRQVAAIARLVKRIRKGSYGVCVAAGRNVPKERLVAIPWASERVEFKVGGLGRR